MRKKAEKVISFLIEHLPLLVTMFFSAYIVSRSQFEAYDTNTLLLWVVSLLGLLATSILVERLSKLRRIENFVEAMHEHLLNQERKPSIDLILSDRKSLPPLESRMQSSREIMISGGSLFRLTSEYIGYFEQKAREGCRMKFLLVKPD